jgi:hypothetical protein
LCFYSQLVNLCNYQHILMTSILEAYTKNIVRSISFYTCMNRGQIELYKFLPEQLTVQNIGTQFVIQISHCDTIFLQTFSMAHIFNGIPYKKNFSMPCSSVYVFLISLSTREIVT